MTKPGRRGFGLLARALLLLPLPLAAQAVCRVDARPLAFGMLWDLSSHGADADSLVLLDCAAATGGLRVSLGPGLNAVQASGRALRNGATSLPYNLYTDAARSQLWGDGTGGSSAAMAPGNAMLTVYARIPPVPTPRPGSYSDAVEVIVDW